MQYFLCVTVKPLISKSCCFRSLHRLSSYNSENNNYRLHSESVTPGFLKIFSFRETIAHFRTIIFSQSPRSFQFSSPILAGWIVFPLANAHHFFACKNSCVQSTVLHRYVDFLQYFSTCKSNQMNIGCQTSLNEEG